jgi:hypothetical protein
MSDEEVLAVRQIAALLDASQKALVAEMAALGTLAGARPQPGEWCAAEVLGHLVEAEKRGFAGRVRCMLADERPTLTAWDQAAVAAARDDANADPDALISEFIDGREDSLALVRSLGPAALARTGVHPVIGEITVGELLHEWIHHDRNHLAQMLAVTQTLAWTGMGNTRRFSDPDA